MTWEVLVIWRFTSGCSSRCSSSSPQILCIRPRLCSLHHCKALPSIHKYDEQQQHKMMKCTYLQLWRPWSPSMRASNSSIASKTQTRKIRQTRCWYTLTTWILILRVQNYKKIWNFKNLHPKRFCTWFLQLRFAPKVFQLMFCTSDVFAPLRFLHL